MTPREEARPSSRLPAWIAAAGLLLFAALWLSLPALSDLRWGLQHHWMVATERWSFRVPLGWRDLGGASGTSLELRRTRWSLLGRRAADRMHLQESPDAFDAVELAQQWDRQVTQRLIPGERLEPTPADRFLRESYRCSDVKRAEDRTISFACFDRQGRWAVFFEGRRGGIREVSRILESATAIGGVER